MNYNKILQLILSFSKKSIAFLNVKSVQGTQICEKIHINFVSLQIKTINFLFDKEQRLKKVATIETDRPFLMVGKLPF